MQDYDVKALSEELQSLMKSGTNSSRVHEIESILSNAPETLGLSDFEADTLLGRADWMGAGC